MRLFNSRALTEFLTGRRLFGLRFPVSQGQRAIRWSVTVASFVLLSWSVAGWVAHWSRNAPSSAPVIALPAADAAARAIATRHLFGVVKAPGNASVEPSMPIGLVGVASASRDGQSFAVLMIDGRPPQAFTVGAELAAGIRLERVAADHVVLATPTGSRVVRLPERPSAGTPGAPK